MMRKAIIAGNWKMYKTAHETAAFLAELLGSLGSVEPAVGVVVAPPFTSIETAARTTKDSFIQVSAQDVYWEDQGAYTGEVSAAMLKESGCSHVIVGHSERRQYFSETDETVNRKLKATVRNNLIPIFCLGETLEERKAGKTFDVVNRQLIEGLRDLRPPEPAQLVIAYEPVWAIGTGLTATPEQAQEVHAFLRRKLGMLLTKGFSDEVRILYGGSVKPDNIRSLMGCEDIDGGLVGGASLKAEDFLAIIREGS